MWTNCYRLSNRRSFFGNAHGAACASLSCHRTKKCFCTPHWPARKENTHSGLRMPAHGTHLQMVSQANQGFQSQRWQTGARALPAYPCNSGREFSPARPKQPSNHQLAGQPAHIVTNIASATVTSDALQDTFSCLTSDTCDVLQIKKFMSRGAQKHDLHHLRTKTDQRLTFLHSSMAWLCEAHCVSWCSLQNAMLSFTITSMLRRSFTRSPPYTISNLSF